MLINCSGLINPDTYPGEIDRAELVVDVHEEEDDTRLSIACQRRLLSVIVSWSHLQVAFDLLCNAILVKVEKHAGGLFQLTLTSILSPTC